MKTHVNDPKKVDFINTLKKGRSIVCLCDGPDLIVQQDGEVRIDVKDNLWIGSVYNRCRNCDKPQSPFK